MSANAPHSSPANESFGCRLRSERERRHIPLASIAENTKISVSLLTDLERDDVSRWPSGIFRRSFIRAYAGSVGLDEDATALEFLQRFPDPNDPADAALQRPTPRSTLRLTLADTGGAFARGRLLASARSRCAAVACDAAVIAALGLGMYAVLGALWMPLAVATLIYYAGGVLLLGNAPGVCLCAPGGPRGGALGGPSAGPRLRALRSRLAAWGRRLRTRHRGPGDSVGGPVRRRRSAPAKR